jgi:hypothetical protein
MAAVPRATRNQPHAEEPGELTAQMNQIEQAVVQRTPGRSQDAGTVA